MENRYGQPAVFTAETLEHALTYAWPFSALKDNLYYKVVLQCEIAQPAVMQRRKGEVLVHEGHVLIRNVFNFFNCAILKGQPKGADLDLVQSLELLPFPLGGSLRFSPMRESAWW